MKQIIYNRGVFISSLDAPNNIMENYETIPVGATYNLLFHHNFNVDNLPIDIRKMV